MMQFLSSKRSSSTQSIHVRGLLFVLLLFGFTPNTMAESVACDDAYVALADDALVIVVTPNGSDDTVNIQCALDAAIADGIPVVALSAGTFFISKLIVEDFKGTLEGKTKTATIIEVLDNTIDCDAMVDAGMASSVIKFINGEPRIRFMTLRASHPCTQMTRISNFLHFTGEAANVANCSNDVIFAAVDRVILDGTDAESGPYVGVSVWPEGDGLGGCKTTLLGTFKINRSELFNTLFGVMTTMKGGAQVDINFNEFHDHQLAIYILDTNQNTTISTNKFFSTSTVEAIYNGVSITTLSPTAPSTTRVVVHNNTFDVSSSAGGPSVAVAGLQDGKIANVSSVVTNNKFNLGGDATWGVFFGDISNTHVSANRFSGEGNGAVFVNGLASVTGWTITANLGLASFTSAFGADLVLGSTTSECIVGPGQAATVMDQGVGNSNLADAGASPLDIQATTALSKTPIFNENLIREEISRHLRSARDLVFSQQ